MFEEHGKWSNSSIKGLVSYRSTSHFKSGFQCRIVSPNDIALFSPNVTPSCDISANPSWSPLSSSLSLPYQPPLFSRPSNILQNPEWSPSWLITPPLRKMVPLSTYQVPVTTNFSDYIDAARATNDPEVAFAVGIAASPTVTGPEADEIDMSLVPVLSREPSPNQESDNFISLTPNIRTTLVSSQESILLRYYHHERPIAIVRPVLKYPIKSMYNLQGKCGRYKSKLRPLAHWFDQSVALSNQMLRRIVAAPNDN